MTWWQWYLIIGACWQLVVLLINFFSGKEDSDGPTAWVIWRLIGITTWPVNLLFLVAVIPVTIWHILHRIGESLSRRRTQKLLNEAENPER